MIGFLGGTGPEGCGLALRFALAGEAVLIGSRDRDRASEVAEGVAVLAPGAPVSGGLNEVVARQADIVFVAVPYSAHRPTLAAVADSLEGKTVVDVVAPLAVRKGVARTVPIAEGSAAQEASAILPGARMVAAFQTVSAHDLLDPNARIDSDVIVCSDDLDARSQIMELAEMIPGIRAVNGGGLANAASVEGLTALLLNINRIYKARSGLRIVGI